MKTGKIINIVSAMLTVAALTACSQDDEQAVKQAEQTPTGVTISVSDLGMTPLKGTPTRALDRKDYTKDFVEGDQIGVFVVNGNDVTANLKYTLNSAGTWEKAEGEAAITHVEGNVYFAYYPYQDGTDKYTILTSDYEAGATTADAFFAGLIKRWRPAYDQSTQAKYSMQDLMVARATVNDGNVLTFQMEHQMAMVEIRFAQVFDAGTIGTKYRFKTDDNYYQGFDFSTNANTETSLRNEYRLIVRPNETTNIQGAVYNPKTDALAASPNWYVTTSNQLAKGQYQVFGTATLASPIHSSSFNLGDILYSDGTFQSSAVSGHGTALGVVVYKNPNPGGTYASKGYNNIDITVSGDVVCEKGLAANKSNVPIAGRGLVMALEDVTSGTETSFIWGPADDEDNSLFPTAGYEAHVKNDEAGLVQTNYLIGDGTTGTCGHTDHEFCKALYTWRNQSAHAVPVGCSDWFVPSVRQLNELWGAMYSNLDGNTGSEATTKGEWKGWGTGQTTNLYGSIRSALLNAGGTMLVSNGYADGYWTISESSSSCANIYFWGNNFIFDVYNSTSCQKSTNKQKVRPVLAF